jgi:hypothetical protein
MRRHETDFVSLVAGVLFLGVAVTYLVAASADYDVDLRWFGPALLIGLGLAGLAGSIRFGAGNKDETVPAEPVDEPEKEDKAGL